ncbi:MAG: helix-turn-helix transcriptional regulator [Candidatus Limnocylindria bacterium]
MANRQPRRTESSRHVVGLLHAIGDDLREARLSAGLNQADVARKLGTTRRRLGRIERGRVPLVPLADLAMHAEIVGLRLHAKLYPGGPPLRDKAQLALLDRLHRRLSSAWQVHLEEPIPLPGDQRAWDMVLRRGNVVVGVEAITRLRDVQAQVRAARLKQKEAEITRLVLLVAATHANRRALAAAGPMHAAFPLMTRSALAALGAGADPRDDAILLL